MAIFDEANDRNFCFIQNVLIRSRYYKFVFMLTFLFGRAFKVMGVLVFRVALGEKKPSIF